MGFNPKANNISWKALENKQVIADGRFGKIEKAIWVYYDTDQKKVEEHVVIKKYKRSSSKFDVLDERDRINTWNHPNLSRLVGVVQNGRPNVVPWLVMEYLNMSDLRSYLLSTKRSGGLNAAKMSKLAYKIASGMDYLHSQGIIHGDLACRNIAVDDKLSQVKINDFGFYDEKNNARFYMHYNQPNFPCPVRWQSPENLPMKLNRRGNLVEVNSLMSKDGDIWSYGCVLFEIWSRGLVPFEGFDNRQVCEMLLTAKKPIFLKNGKDISIRDHVFQTMHSCWRFTPHHRPLFSTIMQHFEAHEDISDSASGKSKGEKVQKKKKANSKRAKGGKKKEKNGEEEGKDTKAAEPVQDDNGGEKKEVEKENDETVNNDGEKVGENGPQQEEEKVQQMVVKNKDDLGYASDGQTLIEAN